MLRGPATHILVVGGARSGKTYLIMKALVLRALMAPEATQAVFRYRFNHLKASIINDTLPLVCKLEFPGQFLYTLNKSDWFAEFKNGHKIYFGGLDDKERTEKILGQGHSTVYMNECSQIGYASRNKAVTRLSQNAGLRLKEICDENPPMEGHWTNRLWVKGVDPSSGQPIPNPHAYAYAFMQPANNPHIPEETKNILRSLPKRDRVRFWDGQFGEAVDNPLWTYESIEASRIETAPVTLTSVVIAVDPSGSHGKEDERSDEVGIIALGLGVDENVYVLEDASGRYGPNGPEGWGAIVVALYKKHKADRVVAETNFGGAMVGAVIGAADPDVPFKEVHAARGKAVRAEPVSTLFDRGRVKLVGTFPEMEEQMLHFSSAGYGGDKSPDRVDAMVWGVHDLAIDMAPGLGLLEWYKRGAAAVIAQGKPKERLGGEGLGASATQSDLVRLKARPGLSGTFYSRSGGKYDIEEGHVWVKPAAVAELLGSGFTEVISKLNGAHTS